ncbi:DUF3900 domain-containing protein [Paenibacillus thalictri]|uniref:DUF3900 domain-containing protein n=1 Tax=Paenibacillus thalictri TaxID=2527873 RepID=A0A4V2J4L2_9BACL|nr:DUF3900 domain-containing protein [Paenibacillus thalictri]TBL80321.1 DUF3900 domain-containing protein [Paenibacillus thalictri]
MNFHIEYLSFFVIQADGEGESGSKNYKHYQTLDESSYEESELSGFLDGELGKIAKRKAERNPRAEQVPTKIGRFIVEPGYGADSNPNFNQFDRLRGAESAEQFLGFADDMLRAYMDASAIRGGVLLIARAKLPKHTDERFVFVMKCDFEQKIARITDERSLLNKVEMAISAKNMKSILYPHMPEPGMIEPWELKIHQASHAKYFEDFLKFVEYEKSVPEIMNERVVQMAQQYIEDNYEEMSPQREQEEKELELWAYGDQRELQEKWTPQQVVEAAAPLIEEKPDLELKLKLGHITVRGLLADYGDRVHIAKEGGRYVILIEGDELLFDRAVSPVELARPETLEATVRRIREKVEEESSVPY